MESVSVYYDELIVFWDSQQRTGWELTRSRSWRDFLEKVRKAKKRFIDWIEKINEDEYEVTLTLQYPESRCSKSIRIILNKEELKQLGKIKFLNLLNCFKKMMEE